MRPRCSSTWPRCTRRASSRPRSSPRPTSIASRSTRCRRSSPSATRSFRCCTTPQTATLSVVTPDPGQRARAARRAARVGRERGARLRRSPARGARPPSARRTTATSTPSPRSIASAHEQFTTMLNVYERNLVSEESMALSLAKEATQGERVLTRAGFQAQDRHRRRRQAASTTSRISRRSTCWSR